VLTSITTCVATAQTILLTIGYLHRSNPELLKQISGSGDFLHMVSNRLSASVPRARFLGMVVATAVSKLVDKPDKVMNFGVEEMDSEEAHAWLGLVDVADNVGDLDDLKMVTTMALPKIEKKRSLRKDSRPPSKPIQHNTRIIAIEEIPDSDKENASSEEEDDPDLRPYGRPDSDPEDSDEDPTLVNRNKPSAPVYITSLLKQLNVSDDLSITELALKTAPSLIRRKTNFGDELSANLLPLASSLLNLQEGMSSKELQRLKVEALIACLVSKPGVMGPWIASMYFEGDFSLSQRAALLATVGLGTRELAGYDDSAVQNASEPPNTPANFPSNRLPPKLDNLYASIASPVSAISTDLSHRTLQPMALEAADKLTGPDILKIRTFSSRMEVQRKAAAKAEARSKRIPKDLHKVLADAIYLPFCSRLTLVLSSLSTSPYLANSTLLHPSLLRLSLQTQAIIISTLGPHALQLPVVTRETLILLTQFHSIPTLAHDPVMLPTILQLLLTVLDLNIEAGNTAEERLVTEFGTMIAELISWSGSLGERVSIPEIDASDSGEMPWPVLVAGIQVKWQEVGKKFQGRMLGLMAGTDFDSF
jgi:telomere length regulation protein